ncbi:unnamed protein product [Menidia menidia]|uniref:(Atlantic silverside) hypothetical protein n=1 Tax=Menidia menidia TaxID=238744 RepID=A0A8S4BK20_9TELE|nr:unnamed protein product [Menidia menidia]
MRLSVCPAQVDTSTDACGISDVTSHGRVFCQANRLRKTFASVASVMLPFSGTVSGMKMAIIVCIMLY